MQKSKLLVILTIFLISIPIAYASLESWIEYDCSTLSGGMTPICNDINILNDKITTLEEVSIVDLITSQSQTYSESISLPGGGSYGFVAECSSDEYIINVGYVSEYPYSVPAQPFLEVFTSYQLNNSEWVMAFSNLSGLEIQVMVIWTCLG